MRPAKGRGLGRATVLAVALTASFGVRADHEVEEVVVPLLNLPGRPFLLVDAPRRFLPTERARVRVQLQEGGSARLALFRVTDTDAVLAVAGARTGATIAASPLGGEAETVLAASSALPRSGARLALLRDERLRMPASRGARDVVDEAEVHDSNEEEEADVATHWGHAGGWSVRNVDLGRLEPGLYLVRVHAGPWAATAIVSVGELVVLARRGDREDVVLVSGPMGEPARGISVRALAAGRELARGVTDALGAVHLPAHDALDVRFVAEKSGDVAWADVAHARLAPCDPRVYVATGRPLYRVGEKVYVRGQVRGCDAHGRYVGLPRESVQLSSPPSTGSRPSTGARPSSRAVSVTTDAHGNFVAELAVESETLVATHRGRRHERRLRIDSLSLPRRFRSPATTSRSQDAWPPPATRRAPSVTAQRKAACCRTRT